MLYRNQLMQTMSLNFSRQNFCNIFHEMGSDYRNLFLHHQCYCGNNLLANFLKGLHNRETYAFPFYKKKGQWSKFADLLCNEKWLSVASRCICKNQPLSICPCKVKVAFHGKRTTLKRKSCYEGNILKICIWNYIVMRFIYVLGQKSLSGLTLIYLLKHRSGIILHLDNSDHPAS